MRADFAPRPAPAGRVPQEVRQDFPHEVGFLRLGAPGLAVPAGSAVSHRERAPPEAGDQTLEGLSRLSRGGLRAADPVSPRRRMEAGKARELGFPGAGPAWCSENTEAPTCCCRGLWRGLEWVEGQPCYAQDTCVLSDKWAAPALSRKETPERYEDCDVRTLGRRRLSSQRARQSGYTNKVSLEIP